MKIKKIPSWMIGFWIGFLMPFIFSIMGYLSVILIGDGCSIVPDDSCFYVLLSWPFGIIYVLAHPLIKWFFTEPMVLNWGGQDYWLKTLFLMIYYGLVGAIIGGSIQVIQKIKSKK